jgi:tetratricopeptide (TPR) repeat protein
LAKAAFSDGHRGKACELLLAALPLASNVSQVQQRIAAEDCAPQDPEERRLAQRAAEGPAGGKAPSADRLAGLRARLVEAPNDIEARVALVDLLLRRRQTDVALATVQDAPPDLLAEPQLLRARAVALMAGEHWSDAARVLDELVSDWPDSGEARYLLADATSHSGSPADAQAHLIDAWRLDADLPLRDMVSASVYRAQSTLEARRRLVAALRDLRSDVPLLDWLEADLALAAGDRERALELLTTLHLRSPDDRRPVVKLIELWVAGGDLAKAAETGVGWVEKHPDDAAMARLLGDIRAEQGAVDAAIAQYRRALAQNPRDVYLLNELALLLTDKEPAVALELAARAANLDATNPQVLDTYATAALATGDTALAGDLSGQAFRLLPQDLDIALNHARALEAAGDATAAMRVLRLIAAQHGEEPRVRNAINDLRRTSAGYPVSD